MRIRRLLGAVLAVSVMLGGLLLVTARPATACTCAQMTEAQLAARIDVLFVGTLVSSRVDPSVLTREHREERKRRERVDRSAVPEPDPVVLTFEVTRVYKGAVGKRQEIVIPHPPVADRRVIETCGSYVPRLRGRGSCSRLNRQVTACSSSIPASTSRASRGIAWDHGRWLTVVHRAVVRRPGWRSARHPRPVVGRQFCAQRAGQLAIPDPWWAASCCAQGPDSSPSPTSLVVGVGVLAAGVAAGLGLAVRRARRRASAD